MANSDKSKRVFAVGDIHGCFDIFMSALKQAGITNDDTLIVTGDLVDRGYQIKEVLDYLFQRPNTKIVLGNHDYAFIRSVLFNEVAQYSYMFHQGLDKTLQQLGEDAVKYADKLSKYPLYYQIPGNDKYIFCHANYPWDGGDWVEGFLWERDGHYPHLTAEKFLTYDGPIIVHGHTPVLKGKSCYEKVGKKIIGINLDMGSYMNLPNSGIRILNVKTGEITEHSSNMM